MTVPEVTRKCTQVCDCYDDDEYIPPNCPVCGGFIRYEDDGDDLKPVCKKCGTELVMLPYSEDGEVIEGCYKICPISERKK